MRILVLNGSPKEKSDTMRMTNAFLKGILETGSHEIKIIDLIKKNIKPCLGCFLCWKNADGKCIQEDDQNEIIEAYMKADLVIWSFPLYSYAMPAHMKACVDRLIPLNRMTMKEVDGHVVHVPRFDLKHQRQLFISGCGFPHFEGNFDGLRIMIRNKFGPEAETILVSETPMMNEPDAAPLVEPLLSKFVLAGKHYGEHLSIPKEMKEELETPMLPRDVYIKIVNSLR